MARAFLYIVGDSNSPDYVGCAVPWIVDKDEIFFGPCMKRLRQKLKSELQSGRDMPPTYIIGLSPNNIPKVRRVLWAGRIKQPMTFAEAHGQLVEVKYQKMRCNESSPLHVRPIEDGGRLVGYERRSELHGGRSWMLDLSDPATLKNESRVNSEDDKRLLLKPGVHPSEGFPRDWCALCENVFFAYEGGPKGLEINGGLVEILQRAQRRDDVDRYGVFGYQGTGQRRRANGKRGIGLQLGGNDADAVIAWIRGSAGSIVKDR